MQEQQEEPSTIHQVAWWYGQSDMGGFVVEVVKVKEQEVVVVQSDQWVALSQLVQEQQEEPSTIHQVAWWYGQSDMGGFVVEVVKVKEQEVVVVQSDQWVALEVHDVQEAVEQVQEVVQVVQ